MACGYCGERLISKTSEGLSCCGCGRSLEQSRPQDKRPLPVKSLIVFSLWVMVALPFIGAIAVTDDLRSGSPSPEVVEAQD